MIIACTVETPLGAMTAAARDKALVGLWFMDQKYYPVQTVDWRWEADHPVLKTVRHFLACYFSGKAATPDIRLAPAGSPFRQTVWNILSTIPIGQVVTYGQIAKQIADARRVPSMSAQAVGSAVAHNPISILIPCHRVVGFNGGLTGYAGGLERKAELLRIEKEISICSGNGVQR